MGPKPLALLFLALTGAFGAACAMSACVGDDGGDIAGTSTSDDGGTSDATTPPPATLKANGLPCGGGTECATGQCADGVCCDSTCDGICEKCNLPGSVGACSPIPDATDPDNECPTTPLDNDAGAPVDAGADSGPPVDAGPVFNTPDGGYPAVMTSQCAGHCNGKRACAYAGTTTTCGTSVCGNSTEQGRATCDGAGHCLYGIEECSAYSCPNGAPGCNTSCSSSSDCLSTYYCDGPTNTCKLKLSNGTICTNVTQCQSGVCDAAAGVCCNADCTATPGGTCAQHGSIGTCTCSACSGPGGCALYYADVDGDGFGDMHGTVANGGAKYGCALASDGPAPANYIADHTDCFDSAAPIANSVHPGQTDYFEQPYNNSGGQESFDYDCSSQVEKETPEAGCKFANYHSYFQQQDRAQVIGPIQENGYCTFDATCADTDETAAHSASGRNGCTTNNAPGFQSTVACGATGASYTCGGCSAAGQTASYSYAGDLTQRCH